MTALEALQACLAGEHAAVYVYGVLGGRVSRSADPTLGDDLSAAYVAHRDRRDELALLVRRAGGEPVPSAAAYELATRAMTSAQLRAEARGLESRAAAVYAQAVASTTGALRRWAVDTLTDAAVRELRFGAEPEAFPGLTELSS